MIKKNIKIEKGVTELRKNIRKVGQQIKNVELNYTNNPLR